MPTHAHAALQVHKPLTHPKRCGCSRPVASCLLFRFRLFGLACSGQVASLFDWHWGPLPLPSPPRCLTHSSSTLRMLWSTVHSTAAHSALDMSTKTSHCAHPPVGATCQACELRAESAGLCPPPRHDEAALLPTSWERTQPSLNGGDALSCRLLPPLIRDPSRSNPHHSCSMHLGSDFAEPTHHHNDAPEGAGDSQGPQQHARGGARHA